MTRRLRCYVAAPRSLARSVVQIHSMLEDHNVKPTSLWADGVAADYASKSSLATLNDSQLSPRRAKWILDDNRKAIAASDVVFAYLPGYLSKDGDDNALWPSGPKETYCELEAARIQGKFIFILGAGDMIPLSILVACHDGDARMVDSVTTAIHLIADMSAACRAFTTLAPCLADLWGEENEHQDAEDAAKRWRLIPGGG